MCDIDLASISTAIEQLERVSESLFDISNNKLGEVIDRLDEALKMAKAASKSIQDISGRVDEIIDTLKQA